MAMTKPFQPTPKQDGVNTILLHSITASPGYDHQSFEELRLEEYLACGGEVSEEQRIMSSPFGTTGASGSPKGKPILVIVFFTTMYYCRSQRRCHFAISTRRNQAEFQQREAVEREWKGKECWLCLREQRGIIFTPEDGSTRPTFVQEPIWLSEEK